MEEIKIRPQQVSDAERFYEILNNDNFIYFDARPSSLKDEIEFIKQTQLKSKNNLEYNFTILYCGEIVGGVGVKIDQHRNFIGEIGYFIDEKYWGKGLAVKATLWLENYCLQELGLKRIIIVMVTENKASERIAIKTGYKKEGIMRKSFSLFGKLEDAYLYAKVSDE